MLRPYNMATGAAPFDSIQVADIGEVPINTPNGCRRRRRQVPSTIQHNLK